MCVCVVSTISMTENNPIDEKREKDDRPPQSILDFTLNRETFQTLKHVNKNVKEIIKG